jgi:hypothetical protein
LFACFGNKEFGKLLETILRKSVNSIQLAGLQKHNGILYSIPEKYFRISFIKNLAPVIQPVLKSDGAKYYITSAKI